MAFNQSRSALSILLRASALAALAALALTDRASANEPVRLAARLAQLRAGGALERSFVESKQLALLAAPLESRGRMAFTPPDELRWEIVAPEPSSLRVAGDRAWLSRPGARERRLDLAADAGARGLVDAVRLLLAGDAAKLAATYEATLAEEGEAWRIALTPRAEAQRRLVARIELAGVGSGGPRELWLHFANGDRSHVSFEPAP
jgi:hypothetical protein